MEEIYIGRQPIFDRHLEVYAYELLFRGKHHPTTSGSQPGDRATAEVLVNAVMEMGLRSLVGSHPAFINLSTGFLDGRYPLPISPDHVGIEVLEDVAPTPAVVDTLRDLNRRGYTIALDDFRYRSDLEPLLDLAHLVKLDLRALDPQELRTELRLLQEWPVKLVAEKVETYDEFRTCHELGFDFFQGYFLNRPQLLQSNTSGVSRGVILQLIARLQSPEADLEELSQLIVPDVALTYRLLRHVNCVSAGLRREVESVRDAILLLGTETIRNWASLILLTRIGDKPNELATTALVRAKMCERLAAEEQVHAPHAYFTAGLFSLLDAFMDRPLTELIGALPLTQAIKQGVLNFEGHLGHTLQRVLWYENGAWEKLEDGALEPDAYTRSYMEALQWASDSAQVLHSPA